MYKNSILRSAVFGIAAAMITVSAFAGSILSSVPAFAAETAVGNTAAVSTEESTAAETAVGNTAAVSTVRETDTHHILSEYADGLDNLYGKTYTGYLCPGKKGKGIYAGYDLSEIPAVDAASMIYDFDEDGEEELLVVRINEDSTMQLAMYEVDDLQEIYVSDIYNTWFKSFGSVSFIRVSEEAHGSTSVFLYEHDGPCIGVTSSGTASFTGGVRRKIMTVKYDGCHFVQDAEPFFSITTGGLFDDGIQKVRGILEAFGTCPLTDAEAEQVFANANIEPYLTNVHEILRTSSKALSTVEDQNTLLGDNPTNERIRHTAIYFLTKNELYDDSLAKRFSGFFVNKPGRNYSFSDDMIHFLKTGSVVWFNRVIAHGKGGNLCSSGFNHIIYDRNDQTEGYRGKKMEISLYFWETADGIYLLPDINDDIKKALLDENSIPETAILVYSEQEKPDELARQDEGDHYRIEKDEKGNTWFREYHISRTGLEARSLRTMIWNPEYGLVAYSQSRTPAGADLYRAWHPDYVEIEDLGFKTK